MNPRTLGAALALSLVLSPASLFAQQRAADLVAPVDDGEPVITPTLSEFRAPQADLRPGGDVRRNGLVAAYPVADNVEIGIGRFTIPEIARPRTHMERERDPTGVRPRDRGIAGLGISLRFRP